MRALAAAYKGTNGSYGSIAYFLLLSLLGMYVVLSLFVSILVEGFAAQGPRAVLWGAVDAKVKALALRGDAASRQSIRHPPRPMCSPLGQTRSACCVTRGIAPVVAGCVCACEQFADIVPHSHPVCGVDLPRPVSCWRTTRCTTCLLLTLRPWPRSWQTSSPSTTAKRKRLPPGPLRSAARHRCDHACDRACALACRPAPRAQPCPPCV